MNISIEPFLRSVCSPERPLLLALSGGPDSMALLYFLLPYRKKLFSELHLAHVDHGWRQESGAEATLLAELAKHESLPFHLKILDVSEMEGNIEEVCRHARLSFFKEVVDQTEAVGVMLGHHADDQAETVLKRLFEGGQLARCEGMKPVTDFEGLQLFRPLLGVQKEELIRLLEAKKKSYFQDSTNQDTAFLRGRMRTQLIPTLEEQFGKKIKSSLLRLSDEVMRLNRYFDQKLAVDLAESLSGPFGVCYNWENSDCRDLLEWEELFSRACQKEHFTCSKEQRSFAATHLFKGGAEKRIEGKRALLIDRRRLFFWKEGTHDWRIREGVGDNKTGWKNAFLGKLAVTLPKGEYTLGEAPKDPSYRDLLSAHKVPHCLWYTTPVLLKKGKLVHEFLTGKAPVAEGVTIELYIF